MKVLRANPRADPIPGRVPYPIYMNWCEEDSGARTEAMLHHRGGYRREDFEDFNRASPPARWPSIAHE